MALHLTNTLTRRKELFVPRDEGKVGIYLCGPTVYNEPHIGNLRNVVVMDVLRRHLIASGYEVLLVRNYTDVDDKIIAESGHDPLRAFVIAEHWTRVYESITDALGVIPPDIAPRATGHIPEMLELVAKLFDAGLAYQSGGDVYFSVAKFPEYGKLSGRDLDELQAGARVEVNPDKRDPLDFVLWKGAKPGEPVWRSPYGTGRPGWHLECSAMACRYLGQGFDIHGGGEDLIFPHHENEIAQSEGATGTPFVKHWIHHAFVRINEEKMSKSLGNFLTIEEILKRVPSEALRLFLVSTHYRSPVDFSDQSLIDAQRACARLHETLARVEEKVGSAVEPPRGAVRAPEPHDLPASVRPFHEQFVTAMDDDLNSARALGVVFDEVREMNRLLDAGSDVQTVAEHQANFSRLGGVLGVLRHPGSGYLESEKGRRVSDTGLDVAEIERLIGERAAARKAKDFKRGDAIRDELLARGIVLKDGAGGTTWSVVQS